jgi:hypothetical protein
LPHAVHELDLREGRNDATEILFKFVQDASRFTACITVNDAATGWYEVLVNTRALQSSTVQHRRMAGAVSQDDWAIAGNRIKVMPRWMSPFGQDELIVSVASEPFVMGKKRETLSKRCLEVANGPRNTQVCATKSACPGKEMEVRVNKPWDDCLSSTREGVGLCGDKGAEVPFCSDRENV